jgi:hypothetical protein
MQPALVALRTFIDSGNSCCLFVCSSRLHRYTEWYMNIIFPAIARFLPTWIRTIKGSHTQWHYRTVSPYWVLPVYVSWFRQFGQTMGTGHYYFDEMRSSFNLVQNQLLWSHKNHASTIHFPSTWSPSLLTTCQTVCPVEVWHRYRTAVL